MTHSFEYSQEVELILVKIAQQHAPRLVPPHWAQPGDFTKPLPQLARQLADYHIFALIGFRNEHFSEDIPAIVRDCVENYGQLYRLFIEVLYPTLKESRALYYSYSRERLLVYFRLEARPLAQVFAGFISPYVVERQAGKAVADVEIQALLNVVLQKLDADDLSRGEINYIMNHGVRIIKRLLGMPLRQMSLTGFDERFFSNIEPPQPTTLPEGGRGPFVGGMDDVNASEQPDFIRDIYAPTQEPNGHTRSQTAPLPPQERFEFPPVTQEDSTVKGETGVQPAIDHPDEPPARRPARRTGLRSPLPYWPDDRKGDA